MGLEKKGTKMNINTNFILDNEDDYWKLEEANWEPYFGNNHKYMDQVKITCGGHVSFKRHLKKPLSQELWEDLRHRLGIFRMRIYKPNDGQWCDGFYGHSCIIQLDDEDSVQDIEICLQ